MPFGWAGTGSLGYSRQTIAGRDNEKVIFGSVPGTDSSAALSLLHPRVSSCARCARAPSPRAPEGVSFLSGRAAVARAPAPLRLPPGLRLPRGLGGSSLAYSASGTSVGVPHLGWGPVASLVRADLVEQFLHDF